MKISKNILKSDIKSLWSKITPIENAKFIADNTITAYLRKDKRINALEVCLNDYEKYLNHQGEIELIKISNSIRMYDFNKLPVLPYILKINEEAITLAKKNGISSIGIKNTGGTHILENWLYHIVENDCIGIFIWNGGPYCVVPYGSRESFFGTNPISYAIPTNSQPLIVDMATSQIPFMNAFKALKENKTIEPGNMIDVDGKPTIDPKKSFNENDEDECRILPMGNNYKGSAIMLLLEILTGSLINSSMGRTADQASFPYGFGGMLICIDINSFTDIDKFKKETSLMLNQIRDSKPADGFNEVILPGDGSIKRMNLANEEVEIDDVFYNRLKELLK